MSFTSNLLIAQQWLPYVEEKTWWNISNPQRLEILLVFLWDANQELYTFFLGWELLMLLPLRNYLELHISCYSDSKHGSQSPQQRWRGRGGRCGQERCPRATLEYPETRYVFFPPTLPPSPAQPGESEILGWHSVGNRTKFKVKTRLLGSPLRLEGQAFTPSRLWTPFQERPEQWLSFGRYSDSLRAQVCLVLLGEEFNPL